jgi:predicted small secreted protein
MSGTVSAARLSFVLPAAALLAACVTMQGGSDYYSAADFSGYRTYSWLSDSPLIRAESGRVEISPLDLRRIREAIERELTGKGFQLVSGPESADFAVAFTVGARDMIDASDYPDTYRGPWRWNAPYYWPNVDIYMYTEGMLAIDIFDNATREPVWHGWARKIVSGADVEDPESAINAAVASILEDFPPEST